MLVSKACFYRVLCSSLLSHQSQSGYLPISMASIVIMICSAPSYCMPFHGHVAGAAEVSFWFPLYGCVKHDFWLILPYKASGIPLVHSLSFPQIIGVDDIALTSHSVGSQPHTQYAFSISESLCNQIVRSSTYRTFVKRHRRISQPSSAFLPSQYRHNHHMRLSQSSPWVFSFSLEK